MKRTTISINQDQRLKLERLAVNATIKSEKTIKWTDIVHHMIEIYSEDAAKDLEHKNIQGKKC